MNGCQINSTTNTMNSSGSLWEEFERHNSEIINNKQDSALQVVKMKPSDDLVLFVNGE